MICGWIGRDDVALLLLKPFMLKARNKGRIVTREAAAIAVPGSIIDQVIEFVALTIFHWLESRTIGSWKEMGKKGEERLQRISERSAICARYFTRTRVAILALAELANAKTVRYCNLQDA